MKEEMTFRNVRPIHAELPPNNPEHQRVNYDGSGVAALHKAANIPYFY